MTISLSEYWSVAGSDGDAAGVLPELLLSLPRLHLPSAEGRSPVPAVDAVPAVPPVPPVPPVPRPVPRLARPAAAAATVSGRFRLKSEL